MKDTTWKPINPCLDCNDQDKEDNNHYYGMDNECRCGLQHDYLVRCNTLLSLFLWFERWEKCDDGNDRYKDVNLSLIREMEGEMREC